MYAVIRTGGKQYLISEGSVIRIEKLVGDTGTTVELDDILFVGGTGEPKVGEPFVTGAKVEAEIMNHAKSKKILIHKKLRRKGYERLRGHRQNYTEIKIKKISV